MEALAAAQDLALHQPHHAGALPPHHHHHPPLRLPDHLAEAHPEGGPRPLVCLAQGLQHLPERAAAAAAGRMGVFPVLYGNLRCLVTYLQLLEHSLPHLIGTYSPGLAVLG